MTDAPVLERTQIKHPCHHCGAPIEVRYNEDHVEQFCDLIHPVQSEDPLELVVTVELEGERLDVILYDDANVTGVIGSETESGDARR